jgi:hypothetical protein
VASALINVGVVQLERGDHGRAKVALERALSIQEHALGPQHLSAADSLGFLGDCERTAGNLVQAKVLYERALAIFESQLGRTHPGTANLLDRLALLANMTGRPRQATSLSKRAATAAVVATHQPCEWCCKMDVHASKKCAQCQAVWYCNVECQRQAWPEHKKHCHKKPATRALPEAVTAVAATAAAAAPKCASPQ